MKQTCWHSPSGYLKDTESNHDITAHELNRTEIKGATSHLIGAVPVVSQFVSNLVHASLSTHSSPGETSSWTVTLRSAMSGNFHSKTQDKTVNITGHEGEGHVEKLTAVGAEFGKGRTLKDVGDRQLNVTGKKGGTAGEISAVGLKFN
ncbi:uncharacterized protein [Haliotis asinina]|uniref:uncharacterized protein n=1 Tax=Haliotis asinina TaxID=109174 RepID=UPI0035320812